MTQAFTSPNSHKRYHLLDTLRGFAVLEMVLYHALWDAVTMLSLPIPGFRDGWGEWWQASIGILFILLSGFCAPLDRHPVRRGLTVLLCALLVTLATLLAAPRMLITFGVLCFLGSAKLLSALLDKPLRRLPAFLLFAVLLFLFIFTFTVDEGYLNLFGFWSVPLPQALYQNYLTAYFGFPHSAFHSGDYYPLLPWIFLFFAGYFLYRIFERKGLLSSLSCGRVRWLGWIGKQALPIYMAHQVLLYAIFTLIGMLST